LSHPKEIFMIRDDLDEIPEVELPQKFTLRSYHKGDEENWFSIYKAADKYNKIYSAMFKQYFGADEVKLGRRQFYVCNEKKDAIATATSWYNDDYHGRSIGRIHWVAVHPDYQGRGLSKPMLSKVLLRLKELGHKSCYLRTYDVRIRAIRLYLSFGLRPDIRNEQDRKIWEDISKEFVKQGFDPGEIS
jgi:GNAT superfamily N-acetyltransferase